MAVHVTFPPGASGFPTRVRVCRMLAGMLTQTALAQRAGLAKNHISIIEGGGLKAPSIITLKKIASAIECDAGWLFDGTGEPPSFLSKPDQAAYEAGHAAGRAAYKCVAPDGISNVSAGWWLYGHECGLASLEEENGSV